MYRFDNISSDTGKASQIKREYKKEVELQKCTLEERGNTMQKICTTLKSGSTVSGGNVASTLVGAYINNKEKVIYCRINKAGSSAAKHYFRSINNDKKSVGGKTEYFPGFKHPQTGYYHLLHLPLSEALEKFGSYRKLVLVRHPLQRFVSAYYEIVVSGNQGIGRDVKNITHFVTDLVTQKRKVHWLDYQSLCHPCQMNYDYVVKMETLKSDNMVLNKLLGGDPNARYPEARVNKNLMEAEGTSSAYKYDEILRDLELQHPDIFRQVLQKYSADMELFGYTWKNGTSGCGGRSSDCC